MVDVFSILIAFTYASSGKQHLCKKLDWGEKPPNTCLKCCKAMGHVSAGWKQHYPMRSDTIQAMQCDKTLASKQKTLYFWPKRSLSSYMRTGWSVTVLSGAILFWSYYCHWLVDGFGELLNRLASLGFSEFYSFESILQRGRSQPCLV